MAKLREMGGKVGSAPACSGSSVDSNPDISQKYKLGDIAKEWPQGGQHNYDPL